MNISSSPIVDKPWFNEIQEGNQGAALFIIAYIGFYGLSIICLFGQQLKETQRQRQELPAYFLKTLWDVPNKNKLYQELADVERLKRIFRGYFADHETFSTVGHDDLQMIVDERAQACASKYREKLRRLHLSHTDYYIDTLQRLVDRVASNTRQEKRTKSRRLRKTQLIIASNGNAMNRQEILAISVV